MGVVGLAQAQSVPGSSLDLRGQVVAPSNSPTLYSTNDLSGNDHVRWTTYLQARIASPWEGEAQLTLPSGNAWTRGGAVAGANYSTQWKVGGSWTGTEPSAGTPVSAVKWSIDPMYQVEYQPISSAVDFSGTGDGYRVIPYKDGLYVVNHHSTTGYLKCRLAVDGTGCPGYGMQGHSFVDSSGTALDTNGNWLTPHNNVEALNASTGEMFMGVTRTNGGGGNYILCTNLNTRRSCGSWYLNSGSGYAVADLDAVGSQYFVLTSDDRLRCFDITTKTSCGTWSYPGSFYQYTTAFLLGGKLYFSPNSHTKYCHDVARRGPCNGWSPNGATSSGLSGALPYLNADGTVKGVCGSNGSSGGGCIDVNGSRFVASTNYSNFVAGHYGLSSAHHHMSAIQGSKWYSAGPNNVGCFDFSTDASCGSHPTNESRPYTTRFDPTRPNCLMTLGDTAHATMYDVTTGLACTGGVSGTLPDIDVDPATYYRCDPGRAMVNAWGLVRMSHGLPWGGANGLDRVTVTLKDFNGAVLPASLRPVRPLPPGTYQLSIADIPYSRYPKLKVSIELHSPGTLPRINAFGADVTWDGDPIQFCATTIQPSQPDCVSTATVAVKTREVDFAAGQFQETLPPASWTMSPGGLSYGYAAMSSATTPRANVRELGPWDPKTYVTQGRWALQGFSGDMWAFGLQNDGQIDASTHLSAQAVSANPGARPLFTAPPADTAAQPVKVLGAGGLTAQQQSALDLNANGIYDGNGQARVSYLRGVDGPFRARHGATLGPVISSGTAVLPMAALAGLNETFYPGYAAYRRDQTRAHPLVLFGGNDGALHAYETLNGALREAWSFVPDVMLQRTARYSDPDIMGVRANPYFVDNVPMVGHVNAGAGNGWRAVAVATYGRGARAITALDVTETDLSRGKGVLFEYQNTTHPDLKDLGYIISQPKEGSVFNSPQIVHLPNGNGPGRGAVLVGNGIDSNDLAGGATASGTGKAVLYAFYFDRSGPRWHRWAVDELWGGSAAEKAVLAKGNGLSTPTAVDTQGNGKVDLIYAGDMQGNLWRFDVRDPNAPVVTRLFKTASGQPISQAPHVTANLAGTGCFGNTTTRCWQVVFATGEPISPLIGTNNLATQSIYGILDKGHAQTVTVGNLQSLSYGRNSVVQGVEYRALDGNVVDYSGGKLGWYVNLQGSEQGVGSPRSQPNGLLMFSSIQPTRPGQAINVCTSPRSWLNNVDAIYGRTSIIPFDVDNNGVIDENDFLGSGTSGRPPASIAISGAQFAPPMVLLSNSNQSSLMSLILPGLGQDTRQANSWSGGAAGSPSPNGPGAGNNSRSLKGSDKKTLGRMTWRQVR